MSMALTQSALVIAFPANKVLSLGWREAVVDGLDFIGLFICGVSVWLAAIELEAVGGKLVLQHLASRVLEDVGTSHLMTLVGASPLRLMLGHSWRSLQHDLRASRERDKVLILVEGCFKLGVVVGKCAAAAGNPMSLMARPVVCSVRSWGEAVEG